MILRLYWWKEFRKDKFQNYGDLMSRYIVKKLSGKIILDSRSRFNKFYKKITKKHYIVIGSIIGSANKHSIVWGSGIISRKQEVGNANFLAVRGPKTRERLLELGYNVPEVYGDPAILLPLFIKNNVPKKYKIGIIPHFVDYEAVKNALEHDNRITVINLLTKNVEFTTKQILECEQIVSSSLHGVIVPHAYGIPALWVKFSEKLSGDNIKFYDYYLSVNVHFTNEKLINPKDLSFQLLEEILSNGNATLLPEEEYLKKMQEKLLESCPFN